MKIKCNCCDGIYNSFDVHFTSACDNRCAHCVDQCYDGLHINKPDVKAIVDTIIENSDGLEDVLFLGGEPCLYLDELIECVEKLKEYTKLKYGIRAVRPLAEKTMRRIARGLKKFVLDNPEPFIVNRKAYALIQYHSETAQGEVRGQGIADPIMTVDGSNRYGLVWHY